MRISSESSAANRYVPVVAPTAKPVTPAPKPIAAQPAPPPPTPPKPAPVQSQPTAKPTASSEASKAPYTPLDVFIGTPPKKESTPSPTKIPLVSITSANSAKTATTAPGGRQLDIVDPPEKKAVQSTPPPAPSKPGGKPAEIVDPPKVLTTYAQDGKQYKIMSNGSVQPAGPAPKPPAPEPVNPNYVGIVRGETKFPGTSGPAVSGKPVSPVQALSNASSALSTAGSVVTAIASTTNALKGLNDALGIAPPVMDGITDYLQYRNPYSAVLKTGMEAGTQAAGGVVVGGAVSLGAAGTPLSGGSSAVAAAAGVVAAIDLTDKATQAAGKLVDHWFHHDKE